MKPNFLFLIVSFCFFTSFTLPTVDLVVYNAHIYTLNDKQPTAEVMFIHNGRVVEIGTKDIFNNYNSIKKIDAKGKFIYPGFIDAHCHFTGYALDRYKLNLYNATSFLDMLNKITVYAKTNQRDWIEGRMWNETWWKIISENEINNTLLNSISTKPIFLLRSDGHTALCNQQALSKAGITIDTKIEGGEIEIRNGKLTGIIKDNAIDYVRKYIPKVDEKIALKNFVLTQQDFFKEGLTAYADCMVENQWWKWLQKAYQQKILTINSANYLTNTPDNLAALFVKKYTQILSCKLAGLKIFADGSLGSHTACLLQPYNDNEKIVGNITTSFATIDSIAKQIAKTNYQLMVHAIGDSANRMVLKIFSNYLQAKNNKRWRIEHAQVVNENDFFYFKKFNIIPSVQPTHAVSDRTMAMDRIGEDRLKNAYAYKKLLQQNAWLPLGTDFPVEYLNPLHTFTSAVFRHENENRNSFQYENALSRLDALKGMTIWAAKSMFWENEMGSLQEGKQANFVMLNVDLLKDNFEKIYTSSIEQTFLKGKVVYKKK